MSFAWSKRQPEAYSEKTGKPDTRGAYGLHGQEMVTWLTQLQHIPEKSVVVVGILDVTYDDFKRPVYEPQIDGRSEEHTSELQSLMRISYAVFCLKKKKKT